MKKKKEQKQVSAVTKTSTKGNIDKWKYYGALVIIVLISFLVYLPALNNTFLSWDDERYIPKNALIYSIDLKEIFSNYVMGNYHPLTILTYAIEYHFWGLNETGYYAVNLTLHLLNVLLVFYAVYLLSSKIEVGLVTALFFGIHPIHVESVAWAAELKDLEYTFFFLGSYTFYLKYLKDQQKKFYVLALLLFLFSLLSKAMAAPLPVVLLLTDFLKGRKINGKVLAEKIPFFVLAIALGVVAVMAQKVSGATDDVDFTFPQHLVFACYGFITYIYKLFLPLQLSAYYPYPIKSGAEMPTQYYAYVFLFAVFAAAVFYSLRFSKKIIFGVGFFAATVFLVLQLLPVGGTIMADRYAYVPSIGIFYLAAEGLLLLWNKQLKIPVILLVTAFTIFLSFKTYAQCSIWKNDLTLWSDVIRQHPDVQLAYNNRGVWLEKNNRVDEALRDFTKTIELDAAYYKAYYNRGRLLMNARKLDAALDDFNKTIELNPASTEAFVNRGSVLRDQNKTEDALSDFRKAIELNPDFPLAYFNRGILYTNEKRTAEALTDFDKAIELNPVYTKAYLNRGNVFFSEKRYAEAIASYSKAIELEPDYADAYYNRGLAEYYFEKKEDACKDINQAARMGYKLAANTSLQICK
jgi:tetratricopeptide (TPR) repeat protein